jgi:hypothetical protein
VGQFRVREQIHVTLKTPLQSILIKVVVRLMVRYYPSPILLEYRSKRRIRQFCFLFLHFHRPFFLFCIMIFLEYVLSRHGNVIPTFTIRVPSPQLMVSRMLEQTSQTPNSLTDMLLEPFRNIKVPFI